MNQRLRQVVAQITLYQYEVEAELEGIARNHTAKEVDPELAIHKFMTAAQKKVYYSSINEKFGETLKHLVPNYITVNLEVPEGTEGTVKLKTKKAVDETSIRDIAKQYAIDAVISEFKA